MTSTLRGAQLTTIQPTDPLKREAGCNPLPSYCHNPVAYTQRIMTQRIATYVITSAAIIGIGTQVTVHQLDKATAHQCINHDWPADAHNIHLAWCAANN